MKTILFSALAALAALSLSSCGECDCNKPNTDYLRDVPVTKSQQF